MITQPVGPWLEVYDGFVDLTTSAELCAFLTALSVAPPGHALRPVTTSTRYLRPCTIDDGSVIARGRVLHAGSTFTTVDVHIEDTLGRGVVHASACVLADPIVPHPPPLGRALDEVADDAVYPTPDPWRRRAQSYRSSDVPAGVSFLGIDPVEASSSRSVTTMAASEWFCNVRREVEAGLVSAHGHLTAALITARIAEPHQRAVTFETSTSFLRPVPADGRPLVCTSTLRARIGDVFVLETETVDADGQQVLVGTGTHLIRERRTPSRRSPAERALLTVLFTDVVGSTEQAVEAGDARWRDLLHEHHALARRQIELHQGREVKTTGDGFLATFDSPSRALHCAREIRDAVARLGLRIRAGVHTGECEVAAGDVVGVAVHVASRVQAAAAPGEILVSSTVRDLVAGSDLRLVERGAYKLKGLDGEWTLLALADEPDLTLSARLAERRVRDLPIGDWRVDADERMRSGHDLYFLGDPRSA